MRTLVFDVDDTLYDHTSPFRRAVYRTIEFPEQYIEALYVAFRKHSDAMFEATETGALSLEDMRLARIQRACLEFDVEIDEAVAAAFQAEYLAHQGEIELAPAMREVLDYCRETGIPMAVITNGPTEHQWRKIKQLGLEQWIARDRIVISSEVGVAKPDTSIFRMVEERCGVSAEELVYIGDAYENDIIGAKDAGWQAIWLNRRLRESLEVPARQDYELHSDTEVLATIQQVFK